MSESITTPPATPAPRYELRPNPLRPWDSEAMPEYVNLDAKPLTFGDALQAINPLQQLPIIGDIYRAVTGATIEPAARVVGGILFGGIFGGISAVANAVIEATSGKDLGGQLIAMVAPDKNAPPAPPTVPADGGPLAPENPGAIHLAAYNPTLAPASAPAGTLERNGLLSTWIAAGAPRGIEDVAPAPAAPRPEIRSAAITPMAAPTAAPIQTASAVPPVQAPSRLPETAAAPSGEVRAMSLENYRARAVANPGMTARAPAINDSLGLAQKGEATRALAAYRSQPGANLLPAALQAQQVYENAGDTPQTFFSASMALGLERYRQMQQQREAAAKDGI